MSPETRQRFLVLIDQMLVALNCRTWETAVQSLGQQLEMLGPGFLDVPLREILSAIDTREKMTVALEQMPEPDPSLLKLLFGKDIPEMRTTVLAVGKALPHDLGGRNRKFPTAEDRARVWKAIKKLTNDDVPLLQAQIRVAKQENAGLSTVQRAWRQRPRGATKTPT